MSLVALLLVFAVALLFMSSIALIVMSSTALLLMSSVATDVMTCLRYCLQLLCLFDLGLTSLSTIFQSYRDGVWMWQGAQCLL